MCFNLDLETHVGVFLFLFSHGSQGYECRKCSSRYSSRPCLDSVQFTPVLALYDPFGVDVPLNLDITYSLMGVKVRDEADSN